MDRLSAEQVILKYQLMPKMTVTSDWGVIPAGEFIKRMPFINGERDNNKEGVADATTKLGGPDLISTRLWWDTGNANNF